MGGVGLLLFSFRVSLFGDPVFNLSHLIHLAVDHVFADQLSACEAQYDHYNAQDKDCYFFHRHHPSQFFDKHRTHGDDIRDTSQPRNAARIDRSANPLPRLRVCFARLIGAMR